jgi:CheY-like chemotaxis protein
MAGHHVQKASSGADALRVTEAFRPRVVVLDIAMPGMSGHAVAEQIRAAAWAKRVTLIALTGHSAPEDVARAKQAGFDHYFVKPVDVQQMLAEFPKPESASSDPAQEETGPKRKPGCKQRAVRLEALILRVPGCVDVATAE